MVVLLAAFFDDQGGCAMEAKTPGNGHSRRGMPPTTEERSGRQASTLDHGDVDDHDNTHRFALGTREVLGIKRPVFTGDGEPLAFARASEDLELASMPFALFVIGATGHIAYANELAEALVGYTRVELTGQMIGHIISGVAVAIGNSATQQPRVRFLSAASGPRVHHRGGRELPASVVLCPHEHGSVIALVTPVSAMVDSVPESRLAEIVHDFKSPLATIALEMCLLEDKLSQQGHPDVSAVVGRVTRNVEFLDCMVQDMLDSCAVAAGELSLRRQPSDLRLLLEHIVERATPTRDRARVFLEAPAGITVSIDELRVERVVSNLLQNALKYTSHVSWIVIRLEARAGVARVSVIDAGPGMTPDELGYIFDKYRRTVGARTREGNGLGLYVSKQIIEAHGGHIGVDSVPGIGSRFFFELPMM
jgi:PAS domain S-box-containing protein